MVIVFVLFILTGMLGMAEPFSGTIDPLSLSFKGFFLITILLYGFAVIKKLLPNNTKVLDEYPTKFFSQNYKIKLNYIVIKTPNSTVLRLNWRDKKNPTQEPRIYRIYKLNPYPDLNIIELGETHETYLNDPNFKPRHPAIYWVECLDVQQNKNRVSNRVFPDIPDAHF